MIISGWKLFSMCLSSFSLWFSVCSLIVSIIRSNNLKKLDEKWHKESEQLFVVSDEKTDQSNHDGCNR